MALAKIAPHIGSLVKVWRGSSVYLGTVESDSMFNIGGRDGFHVHIHNENGRPCSSSLFVSGEHWVLIPI